ncbi:MAG: hypothetical protein ACJA1L_001733 [Paracoccaceae bacterium]|jgi:hypothetical protein
MLSLEGGGWHILADGLEKGGLMQHVHPALSRDISYEIDAQNIITGVDGAWDEFALENDGPGAQESLVVGEPLWSFVSGVDTISHLNAIFFWCRRNGTLFQSAFRCDALTMRRLIRMTVTPLGDGALRIENHLVEAMKRNAAEWHAHGPASGLSSRCSVCCRVQEGAAWVDAGMPPSPLGGVMQRYTICPDCKRAAADVLSEAARISRDG